MKNIQSDIKAFLIKVESLIENDWQLQASVFGFFVLLKYYLTSSNFFEKQVLLKLCSILRIIFTKFND